MLVARLDALGYSVDADQIDAKLVEWIVSFETRNAEHRMAYRRAQLDSLGLPIDVEAALGPTKAGLAARQRQVEEVAAAVNGKPIARRGGGITLDDLFDRWKRERNPAPRSIDECEFTVRRFRELYGRPAINEITRQQVRDFREAMTGFPTRLSNEEARLPLPEILRRYEGRDVPRASAVSARKRLGFLKTLLRLAVDAGDLQENPTDGIGIGEVRWTRRVPFSADDLKAIFARPPFVAGGDHGSIYWLLLLGLHTGARLGELLQIVPTDIQVLDGIEFINITNEGDRRLKTEPAGGGCRSIAHSRRSGSSNGRKRRMGRSSRTCCRPRTMFRYRGMRRAISTG